LIKENIFWLILAILFSLPTFKFLNGLVNKIKNNLVVNVLNTSITVMFFVISIILLVGSSYNPFLYFRF
jgi:alginate O-acetyltransferase complex protein AlgI